MHQFLLATRNAHKTREFAEILGEEFDVHDLTGAVELPPVEETGLTFEANAVLKAVETSKHFPGLVVADDSGLEVDALDGAPGIYSARYAGENATDAENVEKLLGALVRHPPGPHSARFRCSLALARGGTLLEIFHGVVEGTIVEAPQGRGGFGYDPIFLPGGFDRVFAELRPSEKNRISHRARAIQLLRQTLLDRMKEKPA